MQEGDASTGSPDADAATRMERAPARLTIALAWISARRARDHAFDNPGFFANPAWDVLLDLFVSYIRENRPSVGDVCLSSTASASTVLRWILVLEREGLVERSPDSQDRRRILVSLTEAGLAKMELAMDASAESDSRLGLGRLRLIK